MIKIKFFFISVLSLLFVNQSFSSARVELSDVKPLTEQLFSMHVTEKHMDPKLMQRSLFLMIESFDEREHYLLEVERHPYLNMSRDQLERAVACYHQGTFSLHQKLVAHIDSAIERHRQIRAEVKRKVLAQYRTLLVQDGSSIQGLNSREDIGAKIEQTYLGMIQAKLKERGKESFSKSQIEAILTYQDKLWVEHEDKLSGERGRAFFPVMLVKNFAKSMDVHSNYFSPEEAAHLRASLNKQMCGIGVVFRRDFDGLYISEVIKGAPADLSNKVHAGDKVIAVEGKSVEKLGFKDSILLMKGRSGKSLHLTLRKGSGSHKVQEVSLKRAPIVLHDQRVSSQTAPCGSGVIGLIDFPGFYSNGGSISAAQDLKKEIVKLQREGSLKGIVLDMRENGGGFLDQAIKVCKLFMPGGLVAIAKYKDNKVRFMNHVGKKPLYEGPLVILTSKASASAAEIVSQTLQDYGLAIVAGDEEGTFGKGSMQTQTVTNEKAEHFFKVTVARYYTASGRSPQAVGVNSDVVVNSHYFPYEVGEKHLTFALSPDVLDQEVFDQLHRASGVAWSRGSSGATVAQVVPYLQPRMSAMRKRLRHVKRNSEERLKKDKNFQYFLKTGSSNKSSGLPRFGSSDLQMKEATAIIKDLVSMQ